MEWGCVPNYSYTTSRATFPADFCRTDHPSLVRTAPNNWNFDVTYDKKGLSARMGLTHNDGYIWSYGGSNAKDPTGASDDYEYNGHVMVWSAGPDSKIDPGNAANAGANKDNVLSWK